MRRLTAVVASGLLVGGFVVAAPGAWADHGSSGGGNEDFDLTGEFTDFQKDDQGDEGPSEGDTFTVKMDLFDEHGDEAGDGEGTCEATKVDKEAHDFAADCEGVFHLDGGDLAHSGEITDEDFKNGEIVMDIDGDASTGDFEGSSGTVTFSRPEGHGHGDGGHHGHSVEAMDHSGDGGHDKGHGKGHGHHKVDIAVDFDE